MMNKDKRKQCLLAFYIDDRGSERCVRCDLNAPFIGKKPESKIIDVSDREVWYGLSGSVLIDPPLTIEEFENAPHIEGN